MKRIVNALEKAAADTARSVQRQLRRSALEHGWDPKVVANTRVVYKDNQYSVVVSPKYADKAFVHEFGNENEQPTAVVRKLNNRMGTTEKSLLDNLHKHLGGIL